MQSIDDSATPDREASRSPGHSHAPTPMLAGNTAELQSFLQASVQALTQPAAPANRLSARQQAPDADARPSAPVLAEVQTLTPRGAALVQPDGASQSNEAPSLQPSETLSLQQLQQAHQAQEATQQLSAPAPDEPLRAQAPLDTSPPWLIAQARVVAEPPVLSDAAGVTSSGVTSADATSAGAPSAPAGGGAPATPAAAASGGGSWLGWVALLGGGVLLGVAKKGSSNDSPVTPTDTTASEGVLSLTLNGVLMAGPMLKPLTVTAFDAQGNELGSTTTSVDAPGKYSLNIDKSKRFKGGPVLLQVSDPTANDPTTGQNDFTDEATGKPADIGDLRSVVFVDPLTTTNNSALSFHITKLTTLAAERIAPLPSSGSWKLPATVNGKDVNTNNLQVSALFGLSNNITTDEPKAVIDSSNKPSAGNAYGKALAVLSFAQADNTLSIASLVQDLGSYSTTTIQSLSFSGTLASRLQTASLQAATKGYLTTQDASAIQKSTSGSPTFSNDFWFQQSDLDLGTLDPAKALGQVVSQLKYVITPDNSTPKVNALVQSNVRDVRFQLGGADATAFQFDAATGQLSLLASQAAVAQAKGGKAYEVSLTATSDVFNTPDNTSDDLSVTQWLRLKVVDTTKPPAASSPTLAVKAMTGVTSSAGSVSVVGKPAATSAEGFITLTDPDVATVPAGVRHQVVITFTAASDTAGSRAVTRTWSDWLTATDASRRIQLTSDELTRLGDGLIQVKANVTAIDLADNQAVTVVQSTSFRLDTSVGVVTALPLTNVALPNAVPISGDGKLRVSGIESGAQWYYRLDSGDWTLGGTASPQGQFTLDVARLGTGSHTLSTYQVDTLGNVGPTRVNNFNLELEFPTGVDAQIDQLVFYSPISPEVITGTNSELFNLQGSDVAYRLTGKVRGALKAGDRLQIALYSGTSGNTDWNRVSWQNLTIDTDQLAATGESSWSFEPPTFNGAGYMSIRLLDKYQHGTILTTRAYLQQDNQVLLPPTATWLGTAAIDADPGAVASVLRVAVSGLSPHAIAQYQLSTQPNGTLNPNGWSNTLVQPPTNGTYYLFVRQLDVLTGFASDPADPLVVALDTQAPATIASTSVGLNYQPVDGVGGSTTITATTLADTTLIDSGLPRARTVTVTNNGWTELDAGGTVYMRWGRVLKSHVLTLEDIGNHSVAFEWSLADIQNQPGLVAVQAWTTDLTGHTSAVATRQWTVDTAAAGTPKVLGWYTRTTPGGTWELNADGTINKAEASNGVVLKLQLPRMQADGNTPIVWANNSSFQGNAFKLQLLTKLPSESWGDNSVTSASFTVDALDANGVVSWTLPGSSLSTSLWNSLDGVTRDWKVQVLNYNYAFTSPLRQSETLLAQQQVDVVAPSALSLAFASDGTRFATLGLKQPQVSVTVSYVGMAVGDELLFKTYNSTGNSQEVLRYRLKATDITSSEGLGTAVVVLTREALAQKSSSNPTGDGTYGLSLDVTDAAGNTTLWSSTKPSVTLDTQRPAAPTLSVVSSLANPQDTYLNATEDGVDIIVNVANGTQLAATDQIKWVLGTTDFTAANLVKTTAATATYHFNKSDLGPEGVKALRANLVDAAGNLGDYSSALSLILDSQPHDPPVLSLSSGSGNQRFLKAGSTVQLDIISPQMVAGDILQLQLANAAEPVASRFDWGAPIRVTQSLRYTATLSQSALRQNLGLANLPSGEYLVTATLTDLAGNVSTLADAYHLMVDLIAPLNRATPDTAVFSSHALIDDTATNGHHRAFITGQTTPIITVQLDSALQASSNLYGAEFLWGRVDGSVSDDTGWVNLSSFVSGTTLTWDTRNTGALVEGLHVLQLQVRDQAGNRGAITEQTYVLDTQAPNNSFVSNSLHFDADSAPTAQASTALGSDFKTKETRQTLTLDLGRALTTDANDSATWGAQQEHLWGSLDNGVTWVDLSSRVSGSRLTWSDVTLSGSNTARFKIVDVAGNIGAQYSQAYVLDQVAPTARITSISFDADSGASSTDLITNQASTNITFKFNQSLAEGDRVYARLGSGQDPVDLTDQFSGMGLFTTATQANLGSFTLLTGKNTLSVWVEDQVGNVGTVLNQDYVYAPLAPTLDLNGDAVGANYSTTVSVSTAQHGLALGAGIQVQNLPAGVAEVVISYSSSNDNGSDERLLITPGTDVSLNSISRASISGLSLAGVDGLVRLQPGGGSELHFYKQTASGAATSFTTDEVAHLLADLRYFNATNVADASSILPGARSFGIKLIDQAGSDSPIQTATLNLTSASPITGQDGTSGNDTLAGTTGDDLLLGLGGADTLRGGQGSDVMWGGSPTLSVANAGNNTFVWGLNDAVSGTTAHPVTDLIRDFRAWNGTSGDKLDITSLLVGYSASQSASLGEWVQVDNRSTVQGVTNSTRLTIDTNGAAAGGDIQVIELQGVQLSANTAQALAQTQLLKVL